MIAALAAIMPAGLPALNGSKYILACMQGLNQSIQILHNLHANFDIDFI